MRWTFVILVLSITTHSIYYHRPYQPFPVMLWTTSFSVTEAEFCKFSNPLIFFSTFINISSTVESKYKQDDQIFFSWIFYSLLVCLMVFNATFNNISAITWPSVSLVEETGGPGENHRPVASHWQTLSQNWQWGAIKNETLLQKRWFPIPHCELTIYM